MGIPRRVAGFLVFLSAASVGGAVSIRPDPHEPPELTMENMRIQSYGPNGLAWELVAPEGEGHTGSNLMHVLNMNVDLYQSGARSSQITADEAFMNTGSQKKKIFLPLPEFHDIKLEDGDMFLNGHVVVVSTDGAHLSTDWVHYHSSKGLITSTAPVQIIRPDSVTNGIGLKATSDLSNVEIYKQRLVIKDQENE